MEQMDALQIWQIASVLLSWCSLATAMAAFHRAQRYSQARKSAISILGTVMQFFWHLFVVASRVLAIALFTAQFTFWGPVFCGLHVVLMLGCLLWLQTDFCPNRFLEVRSTFLTRHCIELFSLELGLLLFFSNSELSDSNMNYLHVLRNFCRRMFLLSYLCLLPLSVEFNDPGDFETKSFENCRSCCDPSELLM